MKTTSKIIVSEYNNTETAAKLKMEFNLVYPETKL